MALKIDFRSAVLVPEVKIPLASNAFKCFFIITLNTVKRIEGMMEVSTKYTQSNMYFVDLDFMSIMRQQPNKVESAMMSKTVQ